MKKVSKKNPKMVTEKKCFNALNDYIQEKKHFEKPQKDERFEIL